MITVDFESEASAPPVLSALLSLAAIFSRLGMDAGVGPPQCRFALGASEPDTSILIAMAREQRLEATMQIRFEDLPRLARTLPAILRATDVGAVILGDARSDPAKGTIAVVREPGSDDDALIAIDELHLAERARQGTPRPMIRNRSVFPRSRAKCS